MPSPSTAGLQCLFLLVTSCCQTSQDSNFNPFMQYIIDSALGQESFQPEMQRQKRNMLIFDLPPMEYTVDIELSLQDSSYLEPIKDYFKKLSLPVSTNISNVEMTVSNINVTTVCLPSGENSSCCSCEDGYAWPSSECHHLMACPSASPAHNLPCGFRKEMPFSGPYCEPRTEDSCGMGKPSVMNMSVRLETDFWDDLRNSSSDLYRKFKADLEKAFNAGYGCLPGFVSATVTGFRRGSVFVNYEVKAGAANFHQIANSNKMVPQFVDGSYQLNPTTFTTEITDQTNFIVRPVDIFEGDTVKLICEINSTSENVIWQHFDQIISPSSRHLVENKLSRRTSRSILKIINVTMEDAGSYTCTFSTSNRFHTLLYKATKTIAVSPLYIISNLNDINVTCNSPEMQKSSLILSCCIDKHLSSLTGDWKVNGAINITGVSSCSSNCTEYKLNISDSLCIAEKSGTVTTYTCELQTGHGATRSHRIRVKYYREAQVTISSSTKSLVSEGHGFSVMCESDVSNYESISWKILSGSTTITIDCGTCIKNSKFPATSVLKVKNATREWNGTYTCTFSQKYSESSANVTIEVIRLPPKQQIVIIPIEASIRCKMQQTLECCVNDTGDYNVTFVVQQKEFQAGENKKGKYFCYTYNYTEKECGKDNLTAYCKFINRLGQEVNSENISLNLIPDQEVSCSDNLGIGREGGTLKKPCCVSDVFTRGYIIYKCYNKSWRREKDYCVSVSVNNLLTSAQDLVNSPQAKAMLPKYLAELMENTKKELSDVNSSSANLDAIVNILDMVSSIPANAEESIIQNFLSTVDLVVADSTTKAWDDLNKETKQKILNSVENFSLSLQPVNNTIPHVLANTLQLQGIVVTEHSNTDYYKNFSSTENLTVTVLISENEIQTLTQNSTIVSVMYSNLGHILPGNKDGHVNGLVISTTVSSNRTPNFNVSMTFAKKNMSLTRPRCVFWNFTLNGGDWDTHGCTPTESNDSVICFCNHLTSFSILMSYEQSSRFRPEDVITYICLGISILSLVACIIIESLVWKHVTNNTTSYMRHVCILNIATSLLIANVWFLVIASIKDTNQQISRDTCLVATFFMHLFYLCVFFWMLSLGLILFYRLVFILHNTSKTAQKALAFCLGYGCPFVIAVITIAVTLPRNNYTTTDFCWLNWNESKAHLAFIIPALMIVTTNLFITAVVIIKILRPTIGDRSSKQERNSLFQIGKSVAILTPLLGLTWGLGLLTVIKNHSALKILFDLLNGLQILEALLKRNSVSKWSSQQTKSSSLILVTPMLAMSYPFSRTFNNLCGKTGKYTVSSSEPSSSSSENTSKAYSLLN
ncbi:adhesion G protein-coupled receptor F5 isoform X2 [Apus apus]|uniref:adhesion G protein-coupled receptor F5 isoform X2 n=1 Tax=Apus apus TaxID=8895 RepID=UPI0021F8C44E|nr:adhesion G protein-coupled receptor F5 isoform X2 [Apus apus]